MCITYLYGTGWLTGAITGYHGDNFTQELVTGKLNHVFACYAFEMLTCLFVDPTLTSAKAPEPSFIVRHMSRVGCSRSQRSVCPNGREFDVGSAVQQNVMHNAAGLVQASAPLQQ